MMFLRMLCKEEEDCIVLFCIEIEKEINKVCYVHLIVLFLF